jgi:hypothetical protein
VPIVFQPRHAVTFIELASQRLDHVHWKRFI